MQQEETFSACVELFVQEYFAERAENKLTVLSVKGMASAVEMFLDKGDIKAIEKVCKHQREATFKKMMELDIDEDNVLGHLQLLRDRRLNNGQEDDELRDMYVSFTTWFLFHHWFFSLQTEAEENVNEDPNNSGMLFVFPFNLILCLDFFLGSENGASDDFTKTPTKISSMFQGSRSNDGEENEGKLVCKSHEFLFNLFWIPLQLLEDEVEVEEDPGLLLELEVVAELEEMQPLRKERLFLHLRRLVQQEVLKTTLVRPCSMKMIPIRNSIRSGGFYVLNFSSSCLYMFLNVFE